MSAAAVRIVTLLGTLALAPAAAGVATRTRSLLTGRRGPPVWQPYADLWKLVRRGIVYSETTTGAFQAAPLVVLATTLLAALLVPLDLHAAPLRFAGDAVAFVGALALGRFALVLAALDTGSSFEGMGASREVMIATVVDGGLFLVFAAASIGAGEASLSSLFGDDGGARGSATASMIMAGASLFALLLGECGRVPVDDPATHLELTMIHEVAILDHSGPDLAFLLYASALKMSLLSMLVVGALLPVRAATPGLVVAQLAGGLTGVAVGVGVVESVTARVRMPKVPLYLAGGASLALIGLALLLR